MELSLYERNVIVNLAGLATSGGVHDVPLVRQHAFHTTTGHGYREVCLATIFRFENPDACISKTANHRLQCHQFPGCHILCVIQAEMAMLAAVISK